MVKQSKPKGLTLVLLTTHEDGCMQMVAHSDHSFENAVKSMLLRASLAHGTVRSYDVVAFNGRHPIIKQASDDGGGS
jgi:hypothetical protein